MYAHSSHTLANRMFIGGAEGSRSITSSVTRLSQPVGGLTRVRGGNSGYSCTTIKPKAYKPLFFNDPSRSRTAHYVLTDEVVIEGGDSGGPWFFGSSAYGIHTGAGPTGAARIAAAAALPAA